MGPQERFLVTLALIGVVGGALLAGVPGLPGGGLGVQHASSIDDAALKQYPRGPLPRTEPAGWVTEYPSGALQAQLQGRLVTRLKVDAFGDVTNCEVVESSGIIAFDQRSCAALVSKGRFYPALDEDQQPVKSQFVQAVRYEIPG